MVERMSVVVYFTNDDYIKQLAKKDINIYYISANQKYAILYFDKVKEKEVLNLLNHKTIISIETSEVPYSQYTF